MEKIAALSQKVNLERLQFRRIDHRWTSKELLAEKGWFPLSSVMRKLDPRNTGKYRRILALREKMLKNDQNPHRIMGLKPFGSRIWAEMPLFSLWYLTSEVIQVARVPKDWDLETFLNQPKGIFSLRGVLGLIPETCRLKYTAMTHLITRSRDPRSEMGADKLDDAGYVVFMPRFADWLRRKLD